jgi:serine/threonine-protein kinase HipA
MRTARILVEETEAGILTEIVMGKEYRFDYHALYTGSSVSLTMPVSQQTFHYNSFPPFFEGLLPEGHQLEGLLRHSNTHPGDLFSQLLLIGNNTIGAIRIVQ